MESLLAFLAKCYAKLFQSVHPASLAITRILFGFLMILDIPNERGGSEIDIRWKEPENCYFPLFDQMKPLPYHWMCIIYALMWLGTIGIFLGYKFRLACLAFVIPYWYILLLDKSFWNNHSYLYGLIGLILTTSSANSYWSLDVFFGARKAEMVPYWNYFLLKFQIFLLYFYAGLKKTDEEWLDGYSMTHLGKHWVFSTFGIFLTTEQIDIYIVHYTGFILDLTIGFFLIFGKTRPFALIICSMFHVMNSRLFSIGMFPYLGLATLPLFCEFDWPIKLLSRFEINQETAIPSKKHFKKKPIIVRILASYIFLQLFLPYSHFITKGYNNWTQGLYGYSWDMMVHSWDTTLVVTRVVDNENQKEYFLDTGIWTQNNRWNKHADMMKQYAKCMKNNVSKYIPSDNISIYVDVWCSLNGRFQQRMFDPKTDLLTAQWSPFEDVQWVLPLLTEYSNWRSKLKSIQEHVHSWSNYSDVLFIADFPGLHLDNFVSPELKNISLTLIDGEVVLSRKNLSQILYPGARLDITPGEFHAIYTVGKRPACYMYTYHNESKSLQNESEIRDYSLYPRSPFPLLEDNVETVQGLRNMINLIGKSIFTLLLGIPESLFNVIYA